MLITQSVHGFAIKRHDFRYCGLVFVGLSVAALFFFKNN